MLTPRTGGTRGRMDPARGFRVLDARAHPPAAPLPLSVNLGAPYTGHPDDFFARQARRPRCAPEARACARSLSLRASQVALSHGE
jgi:hypothetical protein